MKWLELFTKSGVDRVRLYSLAKAKDLGILGGRVQAWHKRKQNNRWIIYILGKQANKQNESAFKQHEETTGHDIYPNYVERLECGVSNRQKRLFLESSHFTRNTDAVNERQCPQGLFSFYCAPLGIKPCLKTLFNYCIVILLWRRFCTVTSVLGQIQHF